MELFKLDLTQLTRVEEKDRVKGNWYVVADNTVLSTPWIVQWHSKDRSMDDLGRQSVKFKFWLQIPPGLPGFPVAELPDEFDIKAGEWEFKPYGYGTISLNIVSGVYRRIKPTLPKLTIPSGTRAEQIEAVKKLLAELETK